MQKNNSRIKGLLTLLIIYLVISIIGIMLFFLFRKTFDVVINLLIVNVIMTIIVWIFGMIFKTASIYDPYWSYQTLFFYLFLIIYFKHYSIGIILYLIALSYWSIRLTINFIKGFDSLSYIDWRYKMLKGKFPRLFPIINLLGIHMMPTLLVYLASLPFIYYAMQDIAFHYLSLIGFLLMLLFTFIEQISDLQMKKFIKIRKDRSEVINFGLWNYSRHPNYLGEIGFWFGAGLFYIFSDFSKWYLIIGAVMILLMFLVISIPLEEKHILTYKDNYADYQKNTSMLLLWKK